MVKAGVVLLMSGALLGLVLAHAYLSPGLGTGQDTQQTNLWRNHCGWQLAQCASWVADGGQLVSHG